MREWAEILHRTCKAIERRRSAGVPVRKAAGHFAWFLKGRAYRETPRIKVRLSKSMLVAHYYHWRRNGKSVSCFRLHYGDRLTPVTREEIRRFVGACGTAGTTSLGRAAKLAGFERARFCRVRARLPRQLIDQIKGVFKERRTAELAARAAVKQFQWQMHLRLVAEGVRGRRLNRLAASLTGRRGLSGVESTCLEGEAPVQGSGAIFKALPQGVTT